jgi:hypothetical protein
MPEIRIFLREACLQLNLENLLIEYTPTEFHRQCTMILPGERPPILTEFQNN